jgi:hypothetical protein
MSEKSLAICDEAENRFLQILNTVDFPLDVQQGISNVLQIINSNTTMPELYAKELKEIPYSTSLFQDICVQMEEHHTPHRKLRQVMMELGGKLDALDNAKNGHKKAVTKLEKLNSELNELKDIYNILIEGNGISYLMALRLSSINYHTKDGESSISNEIIPLSLTQPIHFTNTITGESINITDLGIVNFIIKKIEIAMANKIIDLEEANRGLKTSENLIKDAAMKASQLQNQVAQYKTQVEESGLSYEESEFFYYTMYFTAEAEKQLRTGDHQIDRGTYGAVGQLPTPIRIKVLRNIAWLQDKIHNDFQNTGTWYREDFYVKTHRDLFMPSRTDEGEIEGMNVVDYLKITPIKVLSDVLMLEGKM